MPEQSASRFGRRWLRLSVRGLIVLVSVIGCWLGWVVRSARIRRNAIAAIYKGGGHIYYNWETDYIGNMSEAKPWWPKWLDSLLGPDYFGHVAQVHLRRSVRYGIGPRRQTHPVGRSLTPWRLSRICRISRD